MSVAFSWIQEASNIGVVVLVDDNDIPSAYCTCLLSYSSQKASVGGAGRHIG